MRDDEANEQPAENEKENHQHAIYGKPLSARQALPAPRRQPSRS